MGYVRPRRGWPRCASTRGNRYASATLRSLSTGAAMWAIVLSVSITLAIVVLVVNVHTPEKEIRHQVEHCHGVHDARFRREMGALLGPDLVSGNRIEALNNGDQIFPAMLAAIASAQHTITFE